MKRMSGQKTTIWWIRESVYAAGPPATLSLATLAAAVTANTMINMTDAIEAGYTLGATDSDLQDSKSVGDFGNAQSRGSANFEADLNFFREADAVTNTTSDFLVAYNEFKAGRVSGYLAKRVGYPKTTALATGQRLSVFHVQSDYPTDVVADGGGPILFHVPFTQLGWMVINQAIVS